MWNARCTAKGHVDSNELRARAKAFAVRVVKFVQGLPHSVAAQELGRQLLRAATGASANYHACGRARSRAEFVAKLGVVLEEADEAEHWLDVLKKSGIGCGTEQDSLIDEASQLRAIFQRSVQTARTNHPIRK